MLLVLVAALGLLLSSVPAYADHGNADQASPNMLHIANLPPPPEFMTGPATEARFFSDLAFWEGGGVRGRHHKLAAQGNYDGFRLIDISNPSNPSEVAVVECRANQGDVSFYQARNRLLLIQSIDRPLTTDDCATARDTGITVQPNPVTGVPAPFFVPGFEGLRIFDVTVPEAPRHIASIPTACGSHTHTTIPDQPDQRAIVYVSSYPIGASQTPQGFDAGGPRCQQPHAKISIVEIPDRAPEAAHVLKEQPLHEDTLPFRGSRAEGGTGAVGCHDITALYEDQASRTAATSFNKNPRFQVAGAACLSEGQLWDISDPANPTTLTTHSHIRNQFIHAEGLFHTSSFTWDGEVVLFTDEYAGGGGSGCKGPEDTRGNVWFYKNVPPGTAVVPLYGRYMFPRVQPPEDACTLHNGNVIPTNDGYFGVSSAYEGGTSVFDFSGLQEFEPILDAVPGDDPSEPVPPLVAREVAFFDALNDPPAPLGQDDAWSSYWHNDYVYVSSGLQRPGYRGFDVYLLIGRNGRLVRSDGTTVTDPTAEGVQQYRARKFRYTNPQTQDTFQTLGG